MFGRQRIDDARHVGAGQEVDADSKFPKCDGHLAKAAAAATQGEGAFAAAFKDMTSVCKECHESFREKVEK